MSVFEENVARFTPVVQKFSDEKLFQHLEELDDDLSDLSRLQPRCLSLMFDIEIRIAFAAIIKEILYRLKPNCACPGCENKATNTENSPYMNEYCDDCTYERHDLPSESGDHHK